MTDVSTSPDSRLRARASTVCITPEHPIAMAGFASRLGPFTSVSGDLEINAVLLEGRERAVLLLSFDLLYVGAALRAAALRAVGGRLPDAAVLTAASHTHYAPASDASKPGLGEVDPTYIEFVVEQISALIETLWDTPAQPASLHLGQALCDANINRRRARPAIGPRGFTRQQLAPNPDGPCDHRVRVVDVQSQDGRSLAIIWSYACHPVGFPEKREVHPGFPGIVRNTVRARDGIDTPTLFFQGFAGDIRPRILDKRRAFLPWLRRVLNGPQFGPFTLPQWQAWSEKIAAAAKDALARAVEVEALDPESRRVERPLGEVLTACEPHETISWQRVTLSGQIEFIGVSAEPVACFATALKDHAWGVGCLDEVFGYFPADAMSREGGYEATGFLKPFNRGGSLQPNLDTTFQESVNSLFCSEDA